MLTVEQLIAGYSHGVFPMAHPEENNKIYWYEPQLRGILPLDGLKISESLRQTLRSNKFHVTISESFTEVMRACASRHDTWISEDIIRVYTELYVLGFAYSFETRNSQGLLVGGLYGVAIGRAFFGESMFYRERDASKVALVHLVNWLTANGYTLLDTQYITPHLATLGAQEIPQQQYLQLLKDALA